MQNVLTTWAALSLGRRIAVAVATAAVFLAVLAVAQVANTPRLALLYSGLDPAAAGEVVAALEAEGVAYRIEGDSIRVPASDRDALRMRLAGQGLPSMGGAGYELLDGLSGFGTTAQMFDAAYWRAKEGELARTILAMPGLRAARVHLARAPDAPFATEAPPTASVTVTSAGAALNPVQARAIRHLVAAAVSGLRPEEVSVIDGATGLIPAEDDGAVPGLSGDRAAELKRNVERLLAARLGPGRAVVEVSLDVATERESLTERRFDPASRVAISQETEERSEQSTQPGGDVTVASNLPEGDAAAGDDGRTSASETRERVNYEVSETNRALERLPGGIRRLTVAVLIDGVAVTAADGSVSMQPRGEEELSALQDLVASAVGLDPARGDVLTIRSLPFEAQPEAGTMVEAGLLAGISAADVMTLVQLSVLGLVALLLGLFVLRPILLGRSAALPAPETPLALPNGLAAAEGSTTPEALRVLTGEIDEGDLPDFAAAGRTASPDPVARLRRLIEERQAETVEILRGWLQDDEERAR